MKFKKLFVIALLFTFTLAPISVFATTPSSSNLLNGIDVSNWQGSINFQEVKNDGIEIVYIKSSQGDNIVDSHFKINYFNAKANGLKVGFYHFLTARNEEEAVSQAEFFSSVISNTTPDCKLAMDFEEFGNLTVGEINNISEVFLEKVKEITGKEVIIYSDASNARNVFREGLALKYPLWIAEYSTENNIETNWQNWEGFQYTNKLQVSGINGLVDGDKFTEDIFLENKDIISQTGSEENYNQDITYIVQKGDTLSKIALDYGTTVNELVNLNKIKNPNLIFPGEEFLVPIKNDGNLQSTSDLGHNIYTVQKGDTLSELAIRFNTTINEIAKINNIKNINLIYVGEKLRIPR